MTSDIIQAAIGALRADLTYARTLDANLDGRERPYNPGDPTDPAVVAQRIQSTIGVLEAFSHLWTVLDEGGLDRGIRPLVALSRLEDATRALAEAITHRSPA